MASLSQRARRRSSLFFGNNFSLASLKSPISPASPSEQISYPNLKHEVRQISAMKEPHRTSSPEEPLFQDSYLSSSEDDSASADFEEPESPTFSECNFHDAEEGYDDDEKEDALEDFGLGFAIETFKPNDVARKVSIVVCKPRVVEITPPTSPTLSRGSSATSSIRPQSRPSSAYFGGWNAFHERQNTDLYASAKSSSEQSNRSSSSSLVGPQSIPKSIDVMDYSTAIVPPMPTNAPLPQRANALKRQSHRLSSSFSRSFLAKAADELPSPTETLRPMTPRPATAASRTPHDRMLSLQIPANFPSVDTMPPPPEVLPRPRTPALKKKKSMADVWFKRRSVSTYV